MKGTKWIYKETGEVFDYQDKLDLQGVIILTSESGRVWTGLPSVFDRDFKQYVEESSCLNS